MSGEQSFNEFRQQVIHKGFNHKVKSSMGVYDMYKWIRKHHWYDIGRVVSEKEFYSIVRGVNRLLAEELALGHTVRLPQRMGVLELRKHQAFAGVVDGKLKVNYPIDWKKTLLLWFEDSEAKDKKILIRNENKWVYHIKYLKHEATYENKIFYQFTLNTFIRRKLSENIKQGKVDTLW